MYIVPIPSFENLSTKELTLPLFQRKPPSSSQKLKENISLSPLINDLLAEHIDLSNTKILLVNESISFKISFQDVSIKNLSLNGLYQYKNQTFHLEINFIANIETINPQEETIKMEIFKFHLEIDVNFTQIRQQYMTNDISQDDVPSFAQKIVEAISKLRAQDKNIDGLELRDKDLLDLIGYDKNQLEYLLRKILVIVKKIANLYNSSFEKELKLLKWFIDKFHIKLNIHKP